MKYSFSRGLDNKITVYPLSFEDDVSTKKKAVGTHTSYMSCCLFPNSDQQVRFNFYCAEEFSFFVSKEIKKEFMYFIYFSAHIYSN